MKTLILCVDDAPDLLRNIELILKLNDYNVITAKNGLDAIAKLEESEILPELIISDIMMPEMNGYDLFEALSKNPDWNRIPFIFLSARTSPKEIRFGKMLGVDDYIKKPFEEEDLIAIVKGKIARNKKIQLLNEDLIKKLKKIDKKIPEIYEKDEISILFVQWDDIIGPRLLDYYPITENLSFSLKEVGNQLYSAISSIYDEDYTTNAESLLLPLSNIKKMGFILFDFYPDLNVRGGYVSFILAIISPNISYFETLKIKNILQNASIIIKNKEKLNLKPYWEKITEILYN